MMFVNSGGFLWLSPIELNKPQLYNQDHPDYKPNHQANWTTKERKEKYARDGLFQTNAELEGNNMNLNRLQQRLLKENIIAKKGLTEDEIKSGRWEYFRKDNQELILDNRLFSERIYKCADVSLLKNPFQNLLRKNAIVSERLNQRKSGLRLFNIIIGSIELTEHPMFIEEDRQMAKLKEKMMDYNNLVSLALIPYYGQVLNKQSKEYDKLNNDHRTNRKDLDLLNKEMNDMKDQLDKETVRMKDLMEEVYDIWKNVQRERLLTNKFTSTNQKLIAQEYQTEYGTKEMKFLQRPCDVTLETTEGASLPGDETKRRENFANTTFYVKLYVNNKLVSKSLKKGINYPDMTVPLGLRYHLSVGTKPFNIYMEILTGGFFGNVIGRAEIEIPGDHVYTITSTPKLFRSTLFQKIDPKGGKIIQSASEPEKDGYQQLNPENQNFIGMQENEVEMIDEPNRDNQDPNNPSYPNNNAPGATDPKKEPIKEIRVSYEGRLNYSVLWEGWGSDMPPPNASGYGAFKTYKKGEYQKLNNIDQEEDENILVDLNDPRNDDLIEKIKTVRNNMLSNKLRDDANFPLTNTVSLRHKLIKHCLLNPEQLSEHETIPMNTQEIASNPKLMKILENYYEDQIKKEENKQVDPNELLFQHNISKADKVPWSDAAVERIKSTEKILLERQRIAKINKDLGISDNQICENYVNEFQFDDEEGDIFAALKEMLAPNRKLRPKLITQEKVSAKEQTVCTLTIHAIKGINIPGRIKTAHSTNKHSLQVNNFQPQYLNAQLHPSGYPQNRPSLQPIQSGFGQQRPSVGFPNQNMQQSGQQFGQQGGYDNYGNPNMGMGGGMNMPGDPRGDPLDQFLNDRDCDPPITYVKVRLVDDRCELQANTDCFEGLDPEWNESLVISYHAHSKNGFTVPELVKNDGMLFISIFDFLGTFGEREELPGEINLEMTKRYMGSLNIPLFTLFLNPKMTSMFRLNRPIFMFGYLSKKANIWANSKDSETDIINPFLPTYISLSLSCDPEFDQPKINSLIYHSSKDENATFQIKCQTWLSTHIKKKGNENKNFKVWGDNLAGHSIFLPRYLKPLNIPTDIPTDNDAYQKLARFVSLIPYKEDSQAFKDLPDIYSTSQEFLDLRAGDQEEHAILQCNWFNWVDDKLLKTNMHSFLIFGDGVPEGNTVWVGRKNIIDQTVEVWNPLTADCFYFQKKVLMSEFMCFNCKTGFAVDSAGNFFSKISKINFEQEWILSAH